MTEKFFLTTQSGLRLECRIDRPAVTLGNVGGGGKLPLIFIAGGFGSDAFGGSTQPPLTDLFLKLGFAVFRMNFRGNGNSEGDLAHATVSAGLDDMNAALDYIRDLPWVKNISLVGNSYGGGLVFHEVAEHPEHKYKFLILLSPRLDTKWRYEDDKDIDLKEWEQKEYIIVHGQKRHYSLYSDTLNYHPWKVAKNITIPTLIVHGDNDDVCPYEQSIRLHGLVKTSELETIKNGGHQYKERIGEVIDIIEKWLVKNNFAIQ